MIASVWWAAVRDLQWRARRVVIATVTTALVFAMTLVLAGLVSSFTAEARRTVWAFGGDAWVVRDGVYGPFTAVSVVPLDAVDAVRSSPGVRAAAPVLVVHETVHTPRVSDLNVASFSPTDLAAPPISRGRLPAESGELALDRSFPGAHVGMTISVSGRTFSVVGITHGMSINGGQPMAYAPLDDVEGLVFPGARVASAIVTRGVPQQLPPGYAMRTVDETTRDTLRPVTNALQSLRTAELLMVAVAALVIGSVVYLSALERQRDFAVLKATGTSSRSLFSSLAFQAVVLAVVAAVLGGFVAQGLVPLFPLAFSIPFSSSALMPAVAVGVGLLASVAAGRRATRVDPALAFGGPG
ncbi:MAG TPA: ABC transporter permease [Mycobacteriales bacterium]|nr:ABC transporter permease [Mycobacteriales bacterium]